MPRLRQMFIAGLVVTSAGWISLGYGALSDGSVQDVPPAARPARNLPTATDRLAARVAATSRAAARSATAATVDPHYIFVLTNACDGLYIGTRRELAGTCRTEFEGGGIGATERVTFRELAGPFASAEEAQEALNRGLDQRREFPISVGTKGHWTKDGRWYGLWNPTVACAL